MTDFATLAIVVDATQPKQAAAELDKLTQAGARTERTTDALGREFVKASSAAGRLRMEEYAARLETERLGVAQQKTSGAGRMLGQQLSQVAQQVAAGGNAIQALAIQLPDIAMGMGAAGASAGKFASFMGGPWGIAVASAVSVLGALAAGHLAASDGSDKQKEAAEDLSKAIDQLSEAVKRETSSELQNTTARIANAIAMRKQTEETLKLAQAELARQKSFLRGAVDSQGNAFTGQAYIEAENEQVRATAAITAQQKAIQGLQADINKSNASVRDLQAIIANGVGAKYFDAAGQAAQRFDNKLGNLAAQFREGKITLQQYAEGAAKLRGTLHAEQEAIEASTKSHRTRKAAMTDAEKAARAAASELKQESAEATRYAESLEDQAKKFGKSAIEIHRMEVAAKAASAPTAELAKRITDAGKALEGLMLGKAAEDFNKMIAALYDEVELSGLVGKARETRALQLEKESKIAEWAKQGLTDLDAKWLAYASARLYGIEQKSTLEKDREDLEILLNRMDALSSAFAGLRGGGGQLGSFLGALTSKDPTAALLGMGGIGTLIGLGTDGGQKAYEKQRQAIEEGLVSVFGEKAQGLAKTLSSVLQGAGTGALVGGILGGGKEAQLGSTIGGALGGAFSKDIANAIGGAAGKIAGAFAPIVGGILGNIVGKMFASTPRGSATFGDSGLVSTRGNSDSRIAAATKAGNSILDTFEQLLGQLGATASGISFSTGVRKGSFTLDPTGAGRTKGSGVLNFGKDEEAYLQAILQEIFSDASFEGISEGFAKYLKSGDASDVEKRIQNLLGLKGVQDQAASLRDPQAFALAELDKWRTKMLAIATEVGEGQTDIEYVYGKERADIIKKYADEVVENQRSLTEKQITILQLEGKQTEALAMARELEMSTMTEAEKALQVRINQLTDDALVAQKTAAITAEANTLQIRLAEALGNSEEALRLKREAELAGIDPLNQALLKLIFNAEDAATATQKAADAQAAMAAAARTEGDLLLRLYRATGQDAAADMLETQRFLGSLPEDLRDLGRQVLDAERIKATAANDNPVQARSFSDKFVSTGFNAANDNAAAEQAALDRLAGLRSQLLDAYEREAGAMKSLIDQYAKAAQTLRDFRDSLFTRENGFENLASLRSKLTAAGASAAGGDLEAMASIPGIGRDFIAAATDQARTMLDVRRAVAFTAGIARQAEAGAEKQVDYNTASLERLDASVNGLVEVKAAVVTVEQAIKALKEEMAKQGQSLADIATASKLTAKNIDDVTRGGALQTEAA